MVELMADMQTPEKFVAPSELGSWRTRASAAAQSVAVISGTFDILQPGNLSAVHRARQYAGRVCVILEPDDITARHTGPGRPWHPLAERAALLSHLRDVAVVTSFSAQTAESYLDSLRPYTWLFCPEQPVNSLGEAAASLAHQRVILPVLPGCFTNDIVKAIRAGNTPISLPETFVETDVASGLNDVLTKSGLPHTIVPGEGAPNSATVTVNGCFDVLHMGHVRFLAEARKLADELVVLLNSDESVRIYKGPDRPVFPLQFRTAALLALEAVARVCPFNEDNPLKALTVLKPQIHVKGGSYKPDRMEQERKLLESWGGRLAFCPMVEGYNTTGFLKRVRKR